LGLLGDSEGKSVTNGDYDEYEEEFDHFSSSHNLSPKKLPSISSLKAPNEELDSRPSSAKNELQFPEEIHKRAESKKNSNINDSPEKYKPKDFSMLSNDIWDGFTSNKVIDSALCINLAFVILLKKCVLKLFCCTNPSNFHKDIRLIK